MAETEKKQSFLLKSKSKKKIILACLAVVLIGGGGVYAYKTFMTPRHTVRSRAHVYAKRPLAVSVSCSV